MKARLDYDKNLAGDLPGRARPAGDSGQKRDREVAVGACQDPRFQINKCAFCLHMHTRDARKAGVSEERIYVLEAWREFLRYTERERAALAWTEALTLLPETNAPNDVYDEGGGAHFRARDRPA